MEIINLKPHLVAHCAAIQKEIMAIDRQLAAATTPQQRHAIELRRQKWVEMASTATDLLKLASAQYQQMQHNKLVKLLENTRLNLEGYDAWRAKRLSQIKNN